MIDIENIEEIKVKIKEAGPPGEKGERGLSAYEVYLKNGGTLSEIEWLESLKGEKGQDGENGQDGYTPIKGTDYWTEADKNEIETYINGQLGVIENGTY